MIFDVNGQGHMLFLMVDYKSAPKEKIWQMQSCDPDLSLTAPIIKCIEIFSCILRYIPISQLSILRLSYSKSHSQQDTQRQI